MLGKQPFTPDNRDFKLSNYIQKKSLPKRPAQFGHDNLVPKWGMLGNDIVGDCVFAGAGHEHMIWSAEGGKLITFTELDIISDYSAVTGYDPRDPSSDRGTIVREAMKYRKNIGMLDSEGIRRKINAYISLEPGNTDELLDALWLFGAVGIGIVVTDSAMKQFHNKKPWSVPLFPSSPTGGHYIPIVAYRNYLYCVTWGTLQPMTLSFYKKYCDEAWVMLSEDMFGDDKITMEGFNFEQLQSDMFALRK